MPRLSAIVVSSTKDIISVLPAGFDPGDSVAAGDGALAKSLTFWLRGGVHA